MKIKEVLESLNQVEKDAERVHIEDMFEGNEGVRNEDEVEEGTEGFRNEDDVNEGNDGLTANEGVRNEDVVEEEEDTVKQTMKTISEGKKNEGKKNEGKENDDNKSPQVMHQQPNSGNGEDATVKQKLIENLESKRRNPLRETDVGYVNRSPYIIREVDINKGISKEEDMIWNYIFKENIVEKAKSGEKNYNMEFLFRSLNDVNITRKELRSLKVDTEVYNNIIDGWVEVLNFKERFRSSSSPYRLFLHTKIVVDRMLNSLESTAEDRYKKFKSKIQGSIRGNKDLIDLKALDMVLFPMMEYNHYYLLIFELKHLGICVIDNFDDSVPLVNLKDHDDYFLKDTRTK
ncbi:hypothetical protein R6Q59_029673 [Mikania micrantha]